MKLKPRHYFFTLVKLLSLYGAGLSEELGGEREIFVTTNYFWPTYMYGEGISWSQIPNSSTSVVLDWDYLPPKYKALEIFLFSVCCIITLITICGNTAVIIVIVFSKLYKKNVFKIYLSMAVADLLLGVTTGLQALRDTCHLMTGKLVLSSYAMDLPNVPHPYESLEDPGRDMTHRRFGWPAFCTVTMTISILSFIMSLALLSVERLLMFWSVLLSKRNDIGNQVEVSNKRSNGQNNAQAIGIHSNENDDQLYNKDNGSQNDTGEIKIHSNQVDNQINQKVHSDRDDTKTIEIHSYEVDKQLNEEVKNHQNDIQVIEIDVHDIDNQLSDENGDNQNDIQVTEIHSNEASKQFNNKDRDNEGDIQVTGVHNHYSAESNDNRTFNQPNLENDGKETITQFSPRKKKCNLKLWQIRLRIPTDKNTHILISVVTIWVVSITIGLISNIDTENELGLFMGAFDPITKLTLNYFHNSLCNSVCSSLSLVLCFIAWIIIVTATISSLIVFRVLQSNMQKNSFMIHHFRREEQVHAVTLRFVMMVGLFILTWLPAGIQTAQLMTDPIPTNPVGYFLIWWLFMAGSSWNWIIYTYKAQQFQDEAKKLLAACGLICDDKERKKKGERQGNNIHE